MVGIRHLKYFVISYECGSYSQASELLIVSRQTIFNAIRELEEQKGILLIKKHKKNIELTPEGEIYYKRAKGLIKEFEGLILNNNSKRKFSIAVNNIFFVFFPSIQRKFIELLSEKDDYFRDFYEFVEQYKVIEAIKNDRVDCGIVMSMGESLDYWSFLLFEVPVHIFLDKNHPLAKNEKVTIKEITNYFIICDRNIKDFYRSVYEVKKAEIKHLNYKIEPTMLKAIAYLCDHKDAILLGNLIIDWSNYYDSIISLPLEDISWNLSLIGKKDNIHKEDCLEFGKYIKKHILPTEGLKYALMENSKESI